jgi:hypothetical protein
MVSVLFTFACLTTATGQPQPPPAPAEKKADKKTDKKPDPTDVAIAAALANDGEVKMAKAKLQLAEAELAKARQAVTLRVVMLKAKIEKLKLEADGLGTQVAIVTKSVEKGIGSVADLLPLRDKYESAKAELAIAEAEWKLLVGEGPGTSGLNPDKDPDRALALGLKYLSRNQDTEAAAQWYLLALEATRERAAVKGPIPDRIRAALDKPVKLGAKDENVTFAQALEVFKKQAGFDVPVRGTIAVAAIISQGEELPVGAWLQLFQDVTGGTFYVREYGLLCTDKKSAPPDAPTLTEFWKQKPPTSEPKAEPKK